MTIDELLESMHHMAYVPNNDNNPYSLHNSYWHYFLADIIQPSKIIILTFQIIDDNEDTCLRRFEQVIHYDAISQIEFIKIASYLFHKYSIYYVNLNTLLNDMDRVKYPYNTPGLD